MAGIRILIVYACLAQLGASQIGAQPMPAISGRVVDQSHSAVAGARITLSRGDEAISDADGSFSLAGAPGDCVLTISARGFSPASRSIAIANQALALGDVVLEVEPMRSAVLVSESASYQLEAVRSASKTLTPLRDLPQSVSVVTREQVNDQMMLSMAEVARYMPGVTAIQGENNRDQLVIRGNSSSADFFLNGVRDDTQYYRDLYNVDDIEALKGPNAMAFGRGGGGGVINRVTKEAGMTPLHEITVLGGAFGDKRVTADLNQPLSQKVAVRLNAMGEDSGSFRNGVELRRYAWNPTLSVAASQTTRLSFGYEHLRDDRVADRGVPSFGGRPAEVDSAVYFGDPDQSHAGARVNIGTATLDQQFGRLNLHNRTLVGDYDRGYQNFVPGALTADATKFALSAYNNATRRRNVFSQTDASYSLSTGRIRHTIVGGVELGTQHTQNYRNTGYFNNTATSIQVAFQAPEGAQPVVFRQSATDADNRVSATVGATYLQDQIALSSRFQVIAGIRFDHFDLQYHNNRNGDNLGRIDNVASPRAGFVFKPASPVSLYANYSISFLPGSGDQFSSLTTITQQVKPERFTNYETGLKWDLNRRFSLTAALYRLDRTNTRSTDPNDPTRIVQTGSQRSNGFEVGWNGSVTRRWSISGGYARQNAFVTSATASAPTGAQVAQVPHQTLSFWNQYRFSSGFGVGLGILNRSDMFAAIDDTVVLPGYTRLDGALYYSVTEKVRLQANFENLLDRRYALNADGNNNISPGSPLAARIGITARF
jgi:catecholate siderophore receptor